MRRCRQLSLIFHFAAAVCYAFAATPPFFGCRFHFTPAFAAFAITPSPLFSIFAITLIAVRHG